MIVAYYLRHNEREDAQAGVVEADDAQVLAETDLYEADVFVRTFASREEADAWIASLDLVYEDDTDPEDEDDDEEDA